MPIQVTNLIVTFRMYLTIYVHTAFSLVANTLAVDLSFGEASFKDTHQCWCERAGDVRCLAAAKAKKAGRCFVALPTQSILLIFSIVRFPKSQRQICRQAAWKQNRSFIQYMPRLAPISVVISAHLSHRMLFDMTSLQGIVMYRYGQTHCPSHSIRLVRMSQASSHFRINSLVLLIWSL
jgi:hypothetical protein